MSARLRQLAHFVARWSRGRASLSRPPMPIIVGSPRSGTTLLRFMLDAHPDMAIPPETGFLSLSDEWLKIAESAADRVFRDIVGASSWNDFHLSADAYQRNIANLSSRNASEVVRLFYRMYASRFGKTRWGEKTPLNCRWMDSIERLLPEAHFIHIVRDGRDVALSLRSRFFSPGHDIEAQALYWRNNVEAARKAGKRCRRYLEIRYEDLLQDVEPELRRICAFVELDFRADMLRYYERAPDRLREHLVRYRADGSVLISQEERLEQQAATMRPPDISRIGVWRHQLSADEIHRFQGVAGALLAELRYPVAGVPDVVPGVSNGLT